MVRSVLAGLAAALAVGGIVPAVVPAGLAAAAQTVESQYSAPGPYSVSTSTATSAAGYTYDLYFPADYSQLGFLSPILTWGNGTGAVPADYTTLLDHLASWGFTIIASTLQNTGSGREILAGAQYLVAEDATVGSRFYGVLNVNEVGAIGHSQGAGGATNAATGDPALIKTLVTFSLPSAGWASANPDCPTAAACMAYPAKLTQPVFFVSTHGFWDSIIAPPSTETAYFDSVQGPAALGIVETSDGKAADHPSIENASAGGNPDGYLGYVTAWLMDQLRGDQNAALAFGGATSELLTDPNWPGSAVKA